MKALLALFLFFASAPSFGTESASTETPVSEAAIDADAVPATAAPDQMECGGCVPRLRLTVLQEPPVPCMSARQAFETIRFINIQDGHGGADCGLCEQHTQKCVQALNTKCKIHATIKLQLKPGYTFRAGAPAATLIEVPVNVITECNTGFASPPIQVFAGTCSFTVQVDYYCSRCQCPQPA